MSRSAAAASRRRRLDSAAGCTYDDASARPSGPSAASAPATAALRSEGDGGHDEDLGPIDLERTRERLDPGRRQVGERHRVTVDEHPLGIDRSVRDARVMERTQGTPHRLTELRRPPPGPSSASGRPTRRITRRASPIESAPAATTGLHRGASTFREQRQECLVLHLLQPRHGEGRPAVAVPDEPPQARRATVHPRRPCRRSSRRARRPSRRERGHARLPCAASRRSAPPRRRSRRGPPALGPSMEVRRVSRSRGARMRRLRGRARPRRATRSEWSRRARPRPHPPAIAIHRPRYRYGRLTCDEATLPIATQSASPTAG